MNVGIRFEDVSLWNGLDDENLLGSLVKFNQKYAEQTSFSNIDVETRQKLSSLFLDRLENGSTGLRREIISFLRLMARDRRDVEVLFTHDICLHLFTTAGLYGSGIQNSDVFMEAEKCLINSLFQCSQARTQFFDMMCDHKLVDRIKLINDEVMSVSELEERCHIKFVSSADTVVQLMQLFDLRIAFITSAHLVALQMRWLEHGYEACFISLIERALQNRCGVETVENNGSKTVKHVEDCANEALKIMFNLYSHATAELADQENCKRAISVCADILLKNGKFDLLKCGALNLLTVVPYPLDFLLENKSGDSFVTSDSKDSVPKKSLKVGAEKDGNGNMAFLDMLLSVLDEHLSVMVQDNEVVVTSCLSILINFCTHSAASRRYVRLKVMPPLHAEDVLQRPEVGDKLRNKLVKVMVGKVHISQVAAHLLFILCKKSVNRFNKYCGFGNAAGLLANYGLLGAINEAKNPDDSEDSETEDFKEVEERVNPVTGYIEPGREDPLKDMTDEQKEYEAMKLVNAMKNLMDKGVITPARTDESGKLRPVEHILELTEGHGKSYEKTGKDSDEETEG